MNVNLTPTQILGGLAVVLVLLWVWRASPRRARAAADATRAGARLLSLTGRVLVGASVLTGVQWMARPADPAEPATPRSRHPPRQLLESAAQ